MMATDARSKPQLGDARYEVEWCTEIPKDEFGDAVHDMAKISFRACESLEEALALAKSKWPEDQYGSVRITPVEFRDPFGDGIYATFLWEPCGDSQYYDGEDA